METIAEYGLKGVTSYTAYENGRIEKCRLSAYNIIPTKYGYLVPQFNNPGIRRKDSKALSYYKSGKLRSISLEEQTGITTSVGTFKAELITFYENGSIDSLFPLNGQISFSWSEEEEGGLAEVYDFDLPIGKFKAKISGLRFYPNGSLKSLILWPGEVIELNTSFGRIAVRNGFKLYENGSLASLEPAEPIYVNTDAGLIKAYDSDAVGVDADNNSLKLSEEGKIIGLATSGDILISNTRSGEKRVISSVIRPGLMEDFVKVPVHIEFKGQQIGIDNSKEQVTIPFNDCVLKIVYDKGLGKSACYGDCSMCSGCSSSFSSILNTAEAAI